MRCSFLILLIVTIGSCILLASTPVAASKHAQQQQQQQQQTTQRVTKEPISLIRLEDHESCHSSPCEVGAHCCHHAKFGYSYCSTVACHKSHKMVESMHDQIDDSISDTDSTLPPYNVTVWFNDPPNCNLSTAGPSISFTNAQSNTCLSFGNQSIDGVASVIVRTVDQDINQFMAWEFSVNNCNKKNWTIGFGTMGQICWPSSPTIQVLPTVTSEYIYSMNEYACGTLFMQYGMPADEKCVLNPGGGEFANGTHCPSLWNTLDVNEVNNLWTLKTWCDQNCTVVFATESRRIGECGDVPPVHNLYDYVFPNSNYVPSL